MLLVDGISGVELCTKHHAIKSSRGSFFAASIINHLVIEEVVLGSLVTRPDNWLSIPGLVGNQLNEFI